MTHGDGVHAAADAAADAAAAGSVGVGESSSRDFDGDDDEPQPEPQPPASKTAQASTSLVVMIGTYLGSVRLIERSPSILKVTGSEQSPLPVVSSHT